MSPGARSMSFVTFVVAISLMLACSRSGWTTGGPYYHYNGAPAIFDTVPMRWTFGCSFPPEMRDAAASGFDFWERTIGVDLFERTDDCDAFGTSGGIVVSYVDRYDVDGDEIRERVVGETWMRGRSERLTGGSIVFYLAWKEASALSMRNASAHEVGHSLGFAHNGRHDCVMFEYVSDEEKAACDDEVTTLGELYAGSR